MPPRIRAQLINDIFSFSQANLINFLRPINLLGYLKMEDDYLPWYIAINKINKLIDLIDSTPLYGQFRNYVIQLMTPIYKKLGWNEIISDSWLDRY